jgi:ABC-type dipeptide/oligopeptide/nickel transport system permease component
VVSYILRRLLLMIPTLLGITFLVFMLIALSPGGIGAGLRTNAGGQMEATSAAIRAAYLEDRYGLDAPAPVQYVRWLGRVSPIKFGTRDQVSLTGERLSRPKEIRDPPLWEWFLDELPEAATPEPVEWPEDATAEARSAVYRGYAETYAQARSKFIQQRARFEQQLGIYADETGIDRPRDGKGKLRLPAFRAAGKPDTGPVAESVKATGLAMLEAYTEASDTRDQLRAAFDAKPYREAGFPVIPGLISIASPDLGVSFSKSRPVSQLIKSTLPVTLLINLVAIPIIYGVSIPFGMLAAVKRGTWIDVVSGAMFIGLYSFPVILAGVLAMGFLASNQYLGAFPVSGLHDKAADTFTFLPGTNNNVFSRGFLVDTIWHICLPVLCLVYTGFAVLSKQTRASMLDNFSADYVRTAKAKGVAEKDVVFRHVFRNSLLPLITLFVSIFPAMLSGSVIVERIFSVPGMGSLVIDGINNRDRELVLATTLMIGIINLLALLLADILYAMADPRITYE